MLIITFTTFLTKGNSLISSLLALLTIPATHIFYGVLFLYGLSKKNNSFNPHQINIDTGEYVGG